MNIHRLSGAGPTELAEALAEFEEQFRYPLGPGRFFRISHGDDYPRFFRAMGEEACFVAERDGKVLGVIGAALRRVTMPGGGVCRAVYVGDVKIDPAARGGRALFFLADAVREWVGVRADVAFAVVMDGTPVTPTRYTGRLGIPQFNQLGKILVLRIPTRSPYARRIENPSYNQDWWTTPAAGGDCFSRLIEKQFACTAGDPAERSEMQSLWFIEPLRRACGRLEDTRRAKRLIADDGSEMRSAHLSCFAYEDSAAGVALLRIALEQAAALGIPALFVAIPAEHENGFRSFIEATCAVVAPATIYCTGFVPGAMWNINTAEI